MVTSGYPMVWRPAAIRYLELTEVGGSFFQKVLIKDQSGVVHILDIPYVRDRNGLENQQCTTVAAARCIRLIQSPIPPTVTVL
jgi:hypothetical protein